MEVEQRLGEPSLSRTVMCWDPPSKINIQKNPHITRKKMPDQQPITVTAAGQLCSLWSTFVFLSCIVLDWQQPGSQLSDPQEENRLYLGIIVYIYCLLPGNTRDGAGWGGRLYCVTQRAGGNAMGTYHRTYQGTINPQVLEVRFSLETLSKPPKGKRRSWNESSWEIRTAKSSCLEGDLEATCPP